MEQKDCKYCIGGTMVVSYDRKEAKLYAEHLHHKNEGIFYPEKGSVNLHENEDA